MFDAFLVFSLILCVATGNAVYALVLLAVSAVLELIDIGKQIYKTVRKEDDSKARRSGWKVKRMYRQEQQ